MKISKKTLFASVVLPLTIGATSVLACDGHEHHKEIGRHGAQKIMSQLNLTDTQKEQLKALREKNKAEMKAIFASEHEKNKSERVTHQEKVKSLLLAENFNEAAANDLATEMVNKQTERRVKMLKRQHEMLKILTQEQREQFFDLKEERKKEHFDK